MTSEAALDATMVDIGEGTPPPGDPPDPGALWVQKVKGSGAGGRVRPELVMDDEFVEGKVRLEFPGGVDGEPVITIEQEVLDVMNGLWKRCMIVKVLGRSISIAVLSKRLKELWKPKGTMHIIDLPRHFFMVRFELEEEYMAALTGGPWRTFGSYLMVQAWTPEFDPLSDDIVTTPVWVRLSNIPVNFYHRAILLCIAKGLGRPVKVDMTMSNFERGRYARVCVEVNLRKPLKGTIQINGERYFVAYEGLTNICPLCGIFGHPVQHCPRKVPEQQTTKAAKSSTVPERGGASGSGISTTVVGSAQVIAQADNGFIVVRRTNRKTVSPAQAMVFAAEKPKDNSGNNQQRILQIKDSANIVLSNSFGNLGEDCAIPTDAEIPLALEANKENVHFSKGTYKGKSVVQVKGGLHNGPMGKGRGPANKKLGAVKVVEDNGPKYKEKASQPTKRLIFGPTREEVRMSESGKRLRVERVVQGRADGVFVANKKSDELERVNLQQAEVAMVVNRISESATHTSEMTGMVEDPPDVVAETRGD